MPVPVGQDVVCAGGIPQGVLEVDAMTVGHLPAHVCEQGVDPGPGEGLDCAVHPLSAVRLDYAFCPADLNPSLIFLAARIAFIASFDVTATVVFRSVTPPP